MTLNYLEVTDILLTESLIIFSLDNIENSEITLDNSKFDNLLADYWFLIGS